MRFDTGLCSISFRGNTPEEIICAVEKTPLKLIEWGSDVHVPCGSEVKLPFPSSSYGTYFRLGTTPIEELDGYIATAKKLGTNILRLWCGNTGSGECADKKALFEECRKAAAVAERADAVLCMECHMGTFTDTVESSLELMQEVGGKHFRMYWQPNQYRSIEENICSAKALSPFVENIHVFNWKGKDRFPLLEARDEWRRYLEHFDRGVLLLEFMPDDRIESLDAEAESLLRIVEDL